MADIAAANVTHTIEDSRKVPGQPVRNRVKIEFGNGTLTYPSGGVPLTKAKMGCPVTVLSGQVIDHSATGIHWKFDVANLKLRGYIQGVIVGAAGSVTMDDFPLNQTLDPLASAVSLSLTNSAGAGTHMLGAMKELVAASAAPVAQTIYLDVTGY